MDPVSNPFMPGPGAAPPELAGRDRIRESVRVTIERVRSGRPSKSVLMVGLRGVGKTVLLDRLRSDAEAAGVHTVRIEVPEKRSLPALLAPQLRQALLRLGTHPAAKAMAERALRALAGFARSLKSKYPDIEVGIDLEPQPGLADNGDLEHDLQDLLAESGRAAAGARTGLAIFIDELQYVAEPELAALFTALHRCSQQALPVLLFGAGLPQLRGRMGDAMSSAERLIDFSEVGPLSQAEARIAIERPIVAEHAAITAEAVERIIAETRGHPYFLQVWGKHSWEVAAGSPIEAADVAVASRAAVAALDEGFFRVRFDRLTPAEKRYLRAMAELGPGPHRSGAIADGLQREVTRLGPTRGSLIGKGMIWSPHHGDTAFTALRFDEFMRRIMPSWTPESP